MSRFTPRSFAFPIAAIMLAASPSVAAAESLKVMTFNVWVAEGTAAGRSKLVQTIAAADADIVGLQEMDNAAGIAVATQLGFYYHQQSGGDIQVLSRYPIVSASPQGLGVEIQYGATASLWLFNAHLAAYPYQPYDLRDGFLPMSENVVIAAANDARGSQVTAYLDDMAMPFVMGKPTLLVGDFNEPSHLDWTAAAAAATPRPYDFKVEYPASKRITGVGMADSFRAVRPDEVADAAYTWTPGYPPPVLDANEVHDRIDILYHRGAGVSASAAWVVGPAGGDPYADIPVNGYNADHRAVVVEYQLPSTTPIFADFNADGLLNQLDWSVVRGNQLAEFSNLTLVEAYARGDLNADRMNNQADFVLFKTAYERTNGAGSFAAMLASVPEPSSLALAAVAICAFRRRAFL